VTREGERTRKRSPVWAVAVAVTASVACGAPSPGPTEPAIAVPWQPPPPIASASSKPIVARAVPPPPVFKCETGKRFEIGARSYCGYSQEDDWLTAEERCVKNGGHLMTLSSEATSKALHAALGSPIGAGRAAWIGLELKKGKPKNEWRWTSGEALTDASWNAGEPNNFGGGEGCGEWLVADGRWNDTRCDMAQPYLCQSKTEKTIACKTGRAFSVAGASYCLNGVERTFADAKRACAADGGGLAVLKTTEENRLVREAMAARFSAPRMWIGLNDRAEEGTWVWVSGAPMEHEAWLPEEPNNFNGESCVELYADSWRWNDRDCAYPLPSVCESAANVR
jgi:hypothetical protein